MILLDTNILGRITNSADPLCAFSRGALDKLRTKGERLVIVPQNLFEFWAVATRPAGKGTGNNGLGMTTGQAEAWCRFFTRRFILLADRAELVNVWLQVVADHHISGYLSHDARLVAAMKTYGITRILTFNAADFSGLGMSIVDPRAV
jgi:predicted nucleic acid-binding protein